MNALRRFLLEHDPLGTSQEITVSKGDLEILADDIHSEGVAAGYEEGWDDAAEAYN